MGDALHNSLAASGLPGHRDRDRSGKMGAMHPAAHLDGDGWVVCTAGHRHWGRHGAAGLLLRAVGSDGSTLVLLQHRASWTHHGDTWGLPGGARASWESPEEAALRETDEEVVLPLTGVSVQRVYSDDHGGWTYWTVVASMAAPTPAAPRNHESVRLDWVPLADVPNLALHPGLAAAWPRLDAGS